MPDQGGDLGLEPPLRVDGLADQPVAPGDQGVARLRRPGQLEPFGDDAVQAGVALTPRPVGAQQRGQLAGLGLAGEDGGQPRPRLVEEPDVGGELVELDLEHGLADPGLVELDRRDRLAQVAQRADDPLVALERVVPGGEDRDQARILVLLPAALGVGQRHEPVGPPRDARRGDLDLALQLRQPAHLVDLGGEVLPDGDDQRRLVLHPGDPFELAELARGLRRQGREAVARRRPAPAGRPT